MMDIVSRNISVKMVRSDLDNIPAHALPQGYAIRRYQRGDEQLWLRIHRVADKYSTITADLFRRQFGDDADALAQRQLFLVDRQGTGIGTTTAWFDDDHPDASHGRIHWVAIVPAEQGRGLSKPLLSLACQRLRDLGHDKAYLTTSTARIHAINLYASFGFVPEIRSDADAEVWREMATHLKAPLDLPTLE